MIEYVEHPIFKEFRKLCKMGAIYKSKEINQLLPQLLTIISPDQIFETFGGLSSSLLHYLVGCPEIKYELLFENKIDCNVICYDYGTPLYQACEYADERAARLLLNHGADVNIITEYPALKRYNLLCTPLEYLVRLHSFEGHSGLFRLLIESGADINHTNELGENVLHSVCSKNDVDSAMFLIESGCNYNQKDFKGKNPLDRVVGSAIREQILKFIETTIECR